MSKRTASKEAMERLHAALAREMETILSEGVTIVNKDTGEPEKVTPGAPYLNVIRQFLSDNKIDANLPADPKGVFEGFLANRLPFQTDEAGA